MELRLPLEMSPGREAACRAVFGTWGFFRTMHVQNIVTTAVTAWSYSKFDATGKREPYGQEHEIRRSDPVRADRVSHSAARCRTPGRGQEARRDLRHLRRHGRADLQAHGSSAQFRRLGRSQGRA